MKEFEELKQAAEVLFIESTELGKITDFSKWADILYLKILAFKNENGVFPNILIATENTFEKIDKEALKHRDRLKWCGEGVPPEQKGIDSFTADSCTVDFCMDAENKLKDGEFRLIYDSSPDFDGEEIPEQDQEEKYIYEYKIAA
jgi:hypothetical protein